MINRIRINNFRSVRAIELELGPLNIVFGPNGCGKSNIYKAIHLLTASANGQFSSYVSEEGGLENIMWSGKQAPTDRHPRRLQIACLTDEFEYELQVGFPEKLPYPTQFMLDPIVKEENIWLSGFNRRPSSRVLQRKNQAAFWSMSMVKKYLHRYHLRKRVYFRPAWRAASFSGSIARAGDHAPLAFLP